MRKLNFGSTLAALFLFFLPWLNFKCSDTSIGTQSGIQTIYGGSTARPELEMLAKKSDMSSHELKEESLGVAPLVAIVLFLTLLAFSISVLALGTIEYRLNGLVQSICLVALGVLGLQMLIGFPAVDSMIESLHDDVNRSQMEGALKPSDEDTAALAAMMNVHVRFMIPLYLVLVSLGTPALMLANSVIDRFTVRE